MEIDWSEHRRFISNALECMRFRLVRQKKDLALKQDENETDDASFPPEFANQPFGQNEIILGYRDLSIKLNFLACSMHCMLEIKFRDKMKSTLFFEPTDIKASLAPYLPKEYTEDAEEFTCWLKDEKSQLYGETICSYQSKKDGETSCSEYFIQRCDLSDQNFLEFYYRLETFVLFFIDGASRIKVSETGWEVFITFEAFGNGNHKKYAPIGLCTLYKFYAYPEMIRPRISQLLVLPQFQHQRHGSKLIETVYQTFNIPSVKDITVESPNEDFVWMRDCFLAKKCSKLEEFKPDTLRLGFTREMYNDANKNTKGSVEAIRRVYYILRVAASKKEDTEDSPEEIKAHLRNYLHKSYVRDKLSYDSDERKEQEKQLDVAVEETYVTYENTAKFLLEKNELAV